MRRVDVRHAGSIHPVSTCTVCQCSLPDPRHPSAYGVPMIYTDVLIDLETLGTHASAPILSIGAVAFNANDPDEKACRTFAMNVNLIVEPGSLPDGDTFYWWLQQSEEARRALLDNRYSLAFVLVAFRDWIELYTVLRDPSSASAFRIWSHGASFDIPILETAYRLWAGTTRGNGISWHYRAPRDTRTLFELADVKVEHEYGTKHVALDDAINEMRAVKRAWSKLTNAVKAGEESR